MSAIVLAALVVMWAVVLVPMFLRRHERADELASADRFAGAMRVLSRPRGPGAGRSGAAPMAAEERAAVIAQAFGATTPTADTRTVTRSVTDPMTQPVTQSETRPVTRSVTQPLTQRERAVARTQAANRSVDRTARIAARRRGLMLMVALVVVTALPAVALRSWWVWLQVVIDLLALAGLAQLRATALADRARGPVLRPSEVPVPQAMSTPQAVEPESGPVTRPRRAARQIVFDAVSEMPIVTGPRLRPAAAASGTPSVPLAPSAFRDEPAVPREAEPLSMPPVVDVDPDTLTSGIELEALRRASGE